MMATKNNMAPSLFNAPMRGEIMAKQSVGNTGTGDETYDLVSILYHALRVLRLMTNT
jgi:hypothetical protein